MKGVHWDNHSKEKETTKSHSKLTPRPTMERGVGTAMEMGVGTATRMGVGTTVRMGVGTAMRIGWQ